MTIAPLPCVPTPEDAERWVLAQPFGAWLRHLVDATGLPWRVIALAAGVPTRTAGRALRGECRKIRRCDGLALLAARPAGLLALGVTQAPAGPTTERARALVAAGVPVPRLAALVGTSEGQVRRIVVGTADTVPVLTALAFAALLEVRDASLVPSRQAAAA